MAEFLPLLALGLVFAAFLRNLGKPRTERGRPERQRPPLPEAEPPARLAELGRRSGLTLRGDVASGELRGVSVRVSSEADRLRFSAALAKPLVGVRRVALRSASDGRPAAVRVSPGFDAALGVELESPEMLSVARSELTGALTNALLRAALEGLEPELTSATVRLSMPSNRRPHEHQSALGQLVTIARAASTRADPAQKSPEETRVLAVWSRLGRVEQDPISLTLVRPSGTFVLELDAENGATHIDLVFPSPVATELHVVSAEQRADPARDFELGDEAFDRAFVVGGERAEAERELGPAVRDALLALVRDGAAVEVRPDVLRVAVDGALDRDSAVEAWLAAMERVAAALAARGERSAYR